LIDGCREALQQCGTRRVEKASLFGGSFLMSSATGIEEFVRQNVGERISDFRRTVPAQLWAQSALFAHAHTHRSLNDAVRAAVGKLRQGASPGAEAFVGSQTVLVHCRGVGHRNAMTALRAKNLQFIITSCPNDEISLLG
jgi:hypothetical protein